MVTIWANNSNCCPPSRQKISSCYFSGWDSVKHAWLAPSTPHASDSVAVFSLWPMQPLCFSIFALGFARRPPGCCTHKKKGQQRRMRRTCATPLSCQGLIPRFSGQLQSAKSTVCSLMTDSQACYAESMLVTHPRSRPCISLSPKLIRFYCIHSALLGDNAWPHLAECGAVLVRMRFQRRRWP